MLQTLRVVAIALFTLVAGSVGYGYAASNSGLSGAGGDGYGAISGYRVDNISYTLNSIDPTRIDAVSFDLDAGSGDLPNVQVKLVSDSAAWHACAVTETPTAARATCQLTTPVAVAAVDEVRVVAAQ